MRRGRRKGKQCPWLVGETNADVGVNSVNKGDLENGATCQRTEEAEATALQRKTSGVCGDQWIHPLLQFCAISCILYKEMVTPKHLLTPLKHLKSLSRP